MHDPSHVSDKAATGLRCPSCGALVDDTGASCPRCDHSLLVNIVAEATVGGEHVRRVARELANLGSLTEQTLRERLEQAPGPILTRATRRAALAHRDALAAHGIPSRLAPAPGRRGRGHGPEEAEQDWWTGRRWIWAIVALVVVTAVVVALGRVVDLMGPDSAAGRPRPDALRQAQASLVTIEPQTPVAGQPVRAAGFVVSGGLVVTGALVGGAEGDRLLVDGGQPARTTTVDEWLGVATVRGYSSRNRSLDLGDATLIQAGDTVLLPSMAVHHALVRRTAAQVMGLAHLELDVAPVPGAGGGPVLDDAGRVVGVLSSLQLGGGVGALAVPVNYLTTGSEPLLPGEVHDPQAWASWLSDAGLPPLRRAEDLAAELARPALLQATLSTGGITMAAVGTLSARAPAPGRLSFRLESGPAPPTLQAPVARWNPTSVDNAGPMPPQTRWLERRGLYLFYFTAEVPLELVCRGCPVAGAELVLLDGRPGKDRTTVAAAVRRPGRSLERRRWQRRGPPTPTPVVW